MKFITWVFSNKAWFKVVQDKEYHCGLGATVTSAVCSAFNVYLSAKYIIDDSSLLNSHAV